LGATGKEGIGVSISFSFVFLAKKRDSTEEEGKRVRR